MLWAAAWRRSVRLSPMTGLAALPSASGWACTQEATSTAPRRCCRRRLRSTASRGTCWAWPLDQQSLAGVSLRAGRARDALDLRSGMFNYVVSCGDAELIATTLEMFAAIAAALGEGLRAARLTGAAEAIRQKVGVPIKQPELFERFLAPARATIAPAQWRAEVGAGRAVTQQEAVALLISFGTALNKRA
jgi:hypothetical protein